jgi:hypothetical protein
MSLAMIGKLERLGGAVKTRTSADCEHHVRNRRLFNFAAGAIQLADWERDHLHECAVCQTMGYVLIRSISRFPDLEFKHIGR